MSNRLLLLATTLLYVLMPVGRVLAQNDFNLFKLPDTVCNGHEIIPFDVVTDAESYSWSFCPPNFGSRPQGENMGTLPVFYTPLGMLITEDEDIKYTFHINQTGLVVRMRFEEGLAGQPSMITNIEGTLTNPKGIQLIKTENWHLFVVEGTDSLNSRLVRYDFNENGLKSMPVEVNLGTLEGQLNGPNQLYIVKDANEWFGFTFNRYNELLRLRFGPDLLSTPSVVNFGNIDNSFNGVSGITGIAEAGSWHLFVTNRRGNNLNRITFGSSFGNTPEVVNLGDLNNRLINPVGIVITKSCDAYYGLTLNYITGSLITLVWDNESITATPQPVNQGTIGDIEKPLILSNMAYDDDGHAYLFAVNEPDSSWSKLVFNACSNANPAYSQAANPSFTLDEPGLYTVFLTINEGLPTVQTACEKIYIYDHTPLTLTNDTLICQWDTIRLSALSFSADSFRWQPDYNIDTTAGQFVYVHPAMTTGYQVTAYYDTNCIVKNTITVSVSKIVADAGPDRTIADGSATVLGGPYTTLGTQYTYLWTPDIGFDYPRDSAFTRVRPPYDLTYYLHISNTDGCSTIDSVQVFVPCNDINLPNVFKPGTMYEKTGTFGLLNHQVDNINYFKIFDRWGKEVFSTTNPEVRWDGNVNGTPAPLGAYVWEIDAYCINPPHQRYRRAGTVILVR